MRALLHRGLASAAAMAALLIVVEAGFAQGTKKDLQDSIQASATKTTLDLGGGAKLDLVLIRPGTFTMGSEKGGDDEKPAHKVTITKPFYVGKYKVTQQQWEAVMGSNPSSSKDVITPAKTAAYPVEKVSYEDCEAFLKKLNEKFGSTTIKFSLPTEAQWEYACRAASTTKYCFGDAEGELGKYAWFLDNSKDKIHPVGEKRANAWGLYDVHGDAWEWCADWYKKDYYKSSPPQDPTGPTSGSFRVCRGSNWESLAPDCRSAFRVFGMPSDHLSWIGLRVVCSW